MPFTIECRGRFVSKRSRVMRYHIVLLSDRLCMLCVYEPGVWVADPGAARCCNDRFIPPPTTTRCQNSRPFGRRCELDTFFNHNSISRTTTRRQVHRHRWRQTPPTRNPITRARVSRGGGGGGENIHTRERYTAVVKLLLFLQRFIPEKWYTVEFRFFFIADNKKYSSHLQCRV